MDYMSGEDGLLFSEEVECASQILRVVCAKCQQVKPAGWRYVVSEVRELLDYKKLVYDDKAIEKSIQKLVRYNLLVEDEENLLYPGKELSMPFYDFLLLYEPWLKYSEQTEDEKVLQQIPVYYFLFPDLWRE